MEEKKDEKHDHRIRRHDIGGYSIDGLQHGPWSR